MKPRTRSSCTEEISGPRRVSSSNGSPTMYDSAASRASCSTSASRDLGTSMRVSALHVCPEFAYAASTPVATAAGKSASSRMTNGDLPPSSSATFFTECDASSATRLPGAGGTGERDHVDVGVRGQRFSDDRTEPADEVEHSRREADFVDDLGEDERIHGRDFRRLEHHGATSRERVRDLRADLVQRVVPRRDATDDADRLPHDEPVAGVFERERRGKFRRGGEPGDPATHLRRHRLVLRHPDFVADDGGELVAPRLERVGDATEELAAVGGGLARTTRRTRAWPLRPRGRCRRRRPRGWRRSAPRWWSR